MSWIYHVSWILEYTPAMKQYIEIKKQYSDCILFFRMWDFYETFFEDAKICSKVLDLVLTSKNKNSENSIPMAGIPYHSSDKYIPKLISKWYKIAIAEQTTSPVPWKIVEREVVSVITPWTYIQESNKNFTNVAAVSYLANKDWFFYHLAWGDFSVWEYRTKSFKSIEDMQKFIMIIKPVEIIVDMDFPQKDEFIVVLQNIISSLISIFDLPANPDRFVMNMTKTQTLQSFGRALESGRLNAFSILLHYFTHTQKGWIFNIVKVGLHSLENGVLFDEVTIRNLEIFNSSYEQSEKYSLIWILDKTKTVWWSRLLRYILANPTKNLEDLNWRLDNIQYYFKDLSLARNINHSLGQVMDIPKMISSLLYKKLTPLTFLKLRNTFQILLDWNVIVNELTRLGLDGNTLKVVQDYFSFLKWFLKEDVNEDMDYICDGYNQEVDELRKIAYHSDDLLLKYQQELLSLTGVGNVKIKYILNQGYFIEVTNKDIQGFESRLDELKDNDSEKFVLMRRNTLKWAQRYTSKYLDSIQYKAIEAKDQLRKMEFKLLGEARENLANISVEMSDFAEKVSRLDVLVAQAILAYEKKYVRPSLYKWYDTSIKWWRHPVIEEFLPRDQQFIANDLYMQKDGNVEINPEIRQKIETNHEDAGFLHVVTGPNMWGKSTFLRQNALIVLMAHCGLFVPADECRISLVDGIFARVWSGDVIAKNQSTFMTEMIEVANIINNATESSFVIFDELGRWTSTYDGLALTRSILEYLAKNIACKTLIATHYHELIEMEKYISWVKNYSVSVYETEKEVVFMKKIIKWWASKSYGLDVAKLAGIRNDIVDQAKEYLYSLEINKSKWNNNSAMELFSSQIIQKIDPKFEKIRTMINSFDINNMTPIQALQLLEKIKGDLR